MARYVQASTGNPFGHTPWQTALYTTFGDFAWLKQPQNRVVREPAGIAPRIRKPPELGRVTIVGGSGRVLGTLGSQVRLGAFVGDGPMSDPRVAALYRMAGGSRYLAAPVAPTVTPVATASGQVSTYTPGAPGAAGSPFAAPAVTGPPPAAPIAAPPAPGLIDQAKAWLAGSMFGGIPNWLAIGGGALLLAGAGSRKGKF